MYVKRYYGFSVLAFILSVAIMIAWLFGNQAWTLFGQTPMNPLVALSIFILSLTVWLNNRHVIMASVAPILLVCALVILDYTVHTHFNIDNHLFLQKGAVRIAPNTATCLIFLSLHTSMKRKHKSFVLITATFFLSLWSIIGYIAGLQHWAEIGHYVPMAFTTAFGVWLLSVGFAWKEIEARKKIHKLL